MSRSLTCLAAAVLAFLAVAGSSLPAAAHGWHRHHHHDRHLHRHVRAHQNGDRSHWASRGLFGWWLGCGLRPFVTYYGSLAYRDACR